MDLVAFTDEILNGKLHFLYKVNCFKILLDFSGKQPLGGKKKGGKKDEEKSAPKI